MILRTEIPAEREKAIERFKWLLSKKARIELKEKKYKRTIRQNAYLHLLFSWFGLQFGYTAEEVKQEIFKRLVNPDIFYNGEKTGIVTIQLWRSTADLDTGEMTIAIERFRKFSAEQGFDLPEPKDLNWLQEIENELNQYAAQQFV